MPRINIGTTKLFFDIYGSKLDTSGLTVKEKLTLIVLRRIQSKMRALL